MFLPAQLICRSKLGATLSFYYMYVVGGGGGVDLFNAQTGYYWEFSFNCARWNMRKACLVHLDTISMNIEQSYCLVIGGQPSYGPARSIPHS
jgi:hypothetical protein